VTSAPSGVPIHSAHIGQEVEIHYRWHPLYGCRVRVRDSEERYKGRVVHVEASPGIVIMIAAWMLDPVACAGMEAGEPRVSVSALRDLHRLLFERSLRGNSLDSSDPVQENRHEHFTKGSSTRSAGATAETSPDEPGIRHSRASAAESGAARECAHTPGQVIDIGREQRTQGA
jgi:hypothetical protein